MDASAPTRFCSVAVSLPSKHSCSQYELGSGCKPINRIRTVSSSDSSSSLIVCF
ncbi:Uncharacterized protein DAT39_012330 [Clarias magur]|uniref:Uncharacterized protein n=1 Tax=Clarias magur TaxID=1594786 RepID=A0A8J4U3N1_CLAMG|nr:Uncharacterized protein DAT39_012330 [Clarias magur]